jgi:hypothetical protein
VIMRLLLIYVRICKLNKGGTDVYRHYSGKG